MLSLSVNIDLYAVRHCIHSRLRQLPTRELFVHTGLIDLLGGDEQLIAAVLSHEISVRVVVRLPDLSLNVFFSILWSVSLFPASLGTI